MVGRRRHDVTMPRESLQFERGQLLQRKGFFVTRCVCAVLVFFCLASLLLASVIGHIYMKSRLAKQNDIDSVLENHIGADDDTFPIHLPPQLSPEYYRLRFIPDLEKDTKTFKGHVQITFNTLAENIAKITLHADELAIEKISLTKQTTQKTLVKTNDEIVNIEEKETDNSTKTNRGFFSKARSMFNDLFVQSGKLKEAKIKSYHLEKERGRLILNLEGKLDVYSKYVLDIHFSGKIFDYGEGMFAEKYVDSNLNLRLLLATNFLPTFARKAFPCFDQPDFKATFEISLFHHENYTAISNSPVAAVEDAENATNFKLTHFMNSKKMSPHSLVFLITNLTSLHKNYQSIDGTTKSINIFAQEMEPIKFALELIPKLLEYLEHAFDMPYPLEKLDVVALPSFSYDKSAGWGVILFDKSNIYFNETTHDFSVKVEVALEIAHSLISQWFGGLATMEWWNDMWLFEGMCTYLKFIAVGKVFKESDALEYLNLIRQRTMSKDEFLNRPSLAESITNEGQIFQKFDEISYGKGVEIFRMLNYTMGEHSFKNAIRKFLHSWKFMAAEEDDLWSAMDVNFDEHESFKKISMFAFLKPWTSQTAYPFINITIDHKAGTVDLEQDAYIGDGSQWRPRQFWYIPLSLKSSNGGNATNIWFTDHKLRFKMNLTEDELIFVNPEKQGYFRINYNPQGWNLVGKLMNHKAIPIASISADALSAARFGLVPYETALSFLANMPKSDGYPDNLIQVSEEIAFLHDMLSDSGYYSAFQHFLHDLIKEGLKENRLRSMEASDGKQAILLRQMMEWECETESERCINWASNFFKEFMENPQTNSIPNIHRPTVYATVLKYGSRKEFNFLWQIYNNETDRTHKRTILNSFGHIRDYSLALRLLETAMLRLPNEDILQIWKGAIHFPFKSALQHYVSSHWDRIRNQFKKVRDIIKIFEYTFGRISTQSEYEQFSDFIRKNKATFPPMASIIKRVNEATKSKLKWKNRHLDEIGTWLLDQYQNSPKHFIF